MDAATGLIYVGNGQYYDPATGRFLSRGVYPGSPNPYVPWQGDPLGMIVGPLALLAMIRGKRKAGRIDRILVVTIMLVGMATTITGCFLFGTSPTPTQPPSPTSTSNPTQPPTATGTPEPTRDQGSQSDNSGTTTPTVNDDPPTPCYDDIPTPTPTPLPDETFCNLLPGGAPTMCNTYLALLHQPGWWNGNKIGTLTPQKFLGLLFRMELNNAGNCKANEIDYSTQGEMAVRNFYAHCRDFAGCTNDSRSANDIFIYRDHKKLLWERPDLIIPKEADKTLIDELWKEEKDYYSNANFEYYFLHPGEWVDGWGEQNEDGLYTAPFDWGNISMIKLGKYPEKYDEAVKIIEKGLKRSQGEQENQFIIVRGRGNSFIFYTLSQRRYWTGS